MKKKLVSFAFVIVMLFTFLSYTVNVCGEAGTSQIIGFVFVTNELSTNVRESSDANSKRIKLVNQGDIFTCIGKKNGWYQILLDDGRIGYISEYVAELAPLDSLSDQLNYVLRDLTEEQRNAIIDKIVNAPDEYRDYFIHNLHRINIVVNESEGTAYNPNVGKINLNFTGRTTKEYLIDFFHESQHALYFPCGSANQKLEKALKLDISKFLLELLEQTGLHSVKRYYELCNANVPSDEELKVLADNAIRKILNNGFKDSENPKSSKHHGTFQYYFDLEHSDDKGNSIGFELEVHDPKDIKKVYKKHTPEEIMVNYFYQSLLNEYESDSLSNLLRDALAYYTGAAFGIRKKGYYTEGKGERNIYDEFTAYFFAYKLLDDPEQQAFSFKNLDNAVKLLDDIFFKKCAPLLGIEPTPFVPESPTINDSYYRTEDDYGHETREPIVNYHPSQSESNHDTTQPENDNEYDYGRYGWAPLLTPHE